jgi:uncharacterized membrane protein
MPTTLTTVALVGATVTTGLTAGLVYAFAHAVMPGLGELDDRSFLAAFGRIDAAITNPWMMLAFLGSPVLTGVALLLQLPDRGAAFWFLAAAAVLVATTVVITGAIHLPLNAAVQAASPELADAAGLREGFERRWVQWNVVRTATSIAATTSLCCALALVGRTAG